MAKRTIKPATSRKPAKGDTVPPTLPPSAPINVPLAPSNSAPEPHPASNDPGKDVGLAFLTIAPPRPLQAPAVARWKRASDSRMRKKVTKIVVLKLAGWKTAEIAKRLKTTPDTIRHYLYIAGKNGWLTGDGELVDPAEQLVYETSHKIVRNINAALDGQILKPQQFEMTVEAAKGTGHFKNHSAAKVEGNFTIPTLEVRFEIPKGSPIEPPVPGSFGGVGSYVEGQTVDPKQLTDGEAE